MQVGSNDLATRLSIAPWHLGILFALMRLFDFFVRTEDPFREDKVLASKSSGLCFQTVYTSRPFFVIKLFDLICYKPFVWHVWHPIYTKTSGNWFLPGHTLFQLMLLCWFTSAQPPSMFLVSRALGTGDTFALAHIWDATQPRGVRWGAGMMTYLARHTCEMLLNCDGIGWGHGVRDHDVPCPWKWRTLHLHLHMFWNVMVESPEAKWFALARCVSTATMRAWKLLQILHTMRDYWSKAEKDGAKGIDLPPASADLQSRVLDHIKCPESQGIDQGDWPFSSNSKICTQACDSFLRRSHTHTQAVLHRQGLRCCYGKGLQWCWHFRPAASLLDLPTHRAQRKDGSHLWRFVPANNWDLGWREKEKSSRVKETWEQVIKAALALYPSGTLRDAGTSKSKLVFSQVPTANAKRVAFHNMLVDSCQVSVRLWCESLQNDIDRVASRKRKHEETEKTREEY